MTSSPCSCFGGLYSGQSMTCLRRLKANMLKRWKSALAGPVTSKHSLQTSSREDLGTDKMGLRMV